MSEKQLTYGQKAVGITFNPGKNENVNEIKELSAALIDEIQTQRLENPNSEQFAQYTLAIRKIQEGQMWAVKAATWNL